MSDLYKILNVSRDADTKQIEQAYKKLALKWHPEKAPAEFKEEHKHQYEKIKEAYDILKDEQSRMEYNVATNNTFQDLKNADRELGYQPVDVKKYSHIVDNQGKLDTDKFNQHYEQVNNLKLPECEKRSLESLMSEREQGVDIAGVPQELLNGNNQAQWQQEFNRLFEQTKSKQHNDRGLAEVNDIPQANQFQTSTGLAEISQENVGTIFSHSENDPFEHTGTLPIDSKGDQRVERSMKDLMREREQPLESLNQSVAGYDLSEVKEYFPHLFHNAEGLEKGQSE